MRDPWVCLGKIVKAQGLRGEVRVRSEIENSENFLLPGLFLRCLDSSMQPVQVEDYRVHKGTFILTLAGCDSMNQAQALIGCELVCRGRQLPPLPDGEYYHYQLIGLPVFSFQGEALGELKEIMATGAHEIYVVQSPTVDSGEKELLLPVVAPYVLEIDLAAGRIIVDPNGGGGLSRAAAAALSGE
ncbi:MAG: 16S rRNA processing protein RimM [Deltaproteobacteria bacterium]|nr:16S rRNA processing protein RimM [Deltaproteobacteria bacterium]